MEPVTIDLSGLGEFGAYAYPLIYMLVSAFFGTVSRRHLSAAGQCLGEGYNTREKESRIQTMKGRTHLANGAVTGAIGLAAFVTALVTSIMLFDKAAEKMSPTATAATTVCARCLEPSFDGFSKLEEARLILACAKKEFEAAKTDRAELFVSGRRMKVKDYESRVARGESLTLEEIIAGLE